MPNNYFQFKQFTVNQDKCSMKVCTDSCLFGAWMAKKIENKLPGKILDIGTGTGLLSLMIAQKSPAYIDTIEIDENAVAQANGNFQASPWNGQLQAFRGSVLSWIPTSKYDCIVSNPPFFENDLLPQTEGKKNSKHGNSLTLHELIKITNALLANDGFFGVLLPYSRTSYFEKQALKHSLFVNEKLCIQQSTNHSYFRAILFMGREQHVVKQTELSIRDNLNEYTPEFIELLSDYYLYL